MAIRCRYLIMPTGVIGTECVNKLKFYFYHVEIFYVKDITDKKVAGQNQEVEGHIAGFKGQEVEGCVSGRRSPRHILRI